MRRGTALKARQANGKLFLVDVPENRYHFVSTWDHIQEINAVPDTVLSLTATAKEILQPEYTMHKFNWANSRRHDSVPLTRTLQTYLTNWLPNLLPDLRCHLRVTFDRQILAGPLKNGVRSPKLFPVLVEAIAYSNIMAFFGKDLVQNPDFMKASVGFIENTLVISEIVRVLPHVVAPIVGRFLARHFNSQTIIFDTLMPIVQQRLEQRERKKYGHEVPEHHSSMTVYNGLLMVPRYAFDYLSTRRVALKPFELSGSHQVPVGEWVCTAPGAMHRDSAYYAKSSEFHGFRFVEPFLYRTILEATNFEIPELGKSSEFVSVPGWQLWAIGRVSWKHHE
ncbi:uncharacterized protein EAF02_001698 [Botrytis sinoallii]|uniref:uncharacterized protein n=1 Tax=Botrytis sinoallii TaxID=1463999 RepID=UPI0019026F09|nr:uncharacterized protein EAF02_001698 [Botrytis sinoallii]KAF7891373.1 hypothetical protein EAF02_001698 [Botrytis sinoallii]